MSLFYNLSDCTISVSDAEGFGLSMLESLSCGTPIMCTMTGGMQEQVTDGTNWFGIGLEPSSKAIIGSQEIPWIYEDRLNGNDVSEAMLKMYNLSTEEREKMSAMGLEHVAKNYSFKNYKERWVEIINETIQKHGSWETRKNYDRWTLKEVQ
jgi:glycosyltransferase involved in cell wall biosynthesis